ncbi:ATP-binding protein [Embleya hyalina]|uniref:DNA topoisomerase (ATP-hydrolyzing) n=1 Tax=Embleya hyalina TaxID=516124 RepID=A0A401YM19_9ACTN|nr:ATP-binding protein [Embleya hyalina]GCD95650.1 DNA gyrase subunit B [Embleya hyalina]
MSDDANTYDASRIRVLEWPEAVRKRPGMYIGSTGERGLEHMVYEVADRAVNEILAGTGGSVDITLMPDGGVCVADDGPGIPVDAAGDVAEPGLKARLTRMSVGARPIGRRDVTLPYGADLSIVNALSSRLTAEVRRDGARWVLEYERGEAVTPPTESGAATGSGTTITFRPDAEIFTTAAYSFDRLAERFRELAFLYRELDISLTDRRGPGEGATVRYRFVGGVRDFVAFLDDSAAVRAAADIVHVEREDSRMAGTLEVALRWGGSTEERVRGFANSRPTVGGTHVEGFRDGLTAALTAYARERGLLTATDPDLGMDRIGVGLTAVVSVKLDAPEFEGSTRAVLGNSPVCACVREAVRERLAGWLGEHPEAALGLVERVVRRSGGG